jgi:hypothetical protein
MPFDSRPEIEAPVLPPFAPGRQGLRNLAYVLRHPALWPKHEWSFDRVLEDLGGCGTAGCALGVATRVWPETSRYLDDTPWEFVSPQVAALFDMPDDDAFSIFINAATYRSSYDDVTPSMVADQIDAYLIGTERGR